MSDPVFKRPKIMKNSADDTPLLSRQHLQRSACDKKPQYAEFFSLNEDDANSDTYDSDGSEMSDEDLVPEIDSEDEDIRPISKQKVPEDSFWRKDTTYQATQSIYLQERDGKGGPGPSKRLNFSKNFHAQGKIDPMGYYFDLFLPTHVLTKIAVHTNVYAQEKIDEAVRLSQVPGSDKTAPKNTVWKKTDPDEIRVFLGLVLLFGVHRLPRLKDAWSDDPMCQIKAGKGCNEPRQVHVAVI
jgi:hypothetical protein